MYTKDPKISVCMVSYNHAKFVGEAIESVLQQSYKNFEFLILEHASTDNSLEIIKKFKDDRIKLTIFDKNYHSTYATNELVSKACGDFYTFLCSDDSWEKTKLEEQVNFLLANQDYDVVFTRINVIDENSERYNYYTPYEYYFNSVPNKTRFEWIRQLFDFQFNPFCCSSAMMKAVTWNQFGPFEIRSRNMQDFLLWTKILMEKNVYVLDKRLTNMRYFVSQSNVTGNTFKHMCTVCNESVLSHENMFKNIDTLDKFKRIFPDAVQQYKNLYAEDIPFYLAQIGIYAHRWDLKSYSMNMLYKLCGDKEIRERLSMRYGFTHLDLYSIAESIDVYNYQFIMPFKQIFIRKIKSKFYEKKKNFLSRRAVRFIVEKILAAERFCLFFCKFLKKKFK